MAVKPIPEGYRTITPRLFVEEPERLIAFLKASFGAVERPRDSRSPAELTIGDSMIIVSGTGARDATASFLYLYVPDADSAYRRAIDAGAKSLETPQKMHYGDLRAMVEDPAGNIWQIATHVEDVSAEEITRRLNSAG
jgi:PhnB protein